MHELGITQHLLDLATQHAREHNATRVTAVHLAIGELSSFVDDAVRFCWQHLSSGTMCEGAELSFRKVPAEVRCLDCGLTAAMGDGPAPCSSCCGSRLRVVAGADLILESLDLEIDNEEQEERA